MVEKIDYERNVFINCPFDDDYDKIFNAILFVTHRCGFVLRCSKEYEDSSSIRIQNIIQLIRESKYSIHDLSRVSLDETANLPRFNMPLELGICIGAIEFGNKKQKNNKYLIIESEKFRFKQFISDLSGQDIRDHKDTDEGAIKIIRNWLSNKTTEKIPSASIIISDYKRFLADLPDLCEENMWTIEELTFDEYSTLVTSWLTFE
jgi:intergrase/recombinase